MFLGIYILLKLGSKIDDYEKTCRLVDIRKDGKFRLFEKRYTKRRNFPSFRKAIYEKTEISDFSKSDIRKDGTFRLFKKRYTKRRNFPTFRKADYEKTNLSTRYGVWDYTFFFFIRITFIRMLRVKNSHFLGIS